MLYCIDIKTSQVHVLGCPQISHKNKKKKYVYLRTDKEFYKIASSQVTPGMFVDYKVEVGSESNILLYILFSVIFLGIVSLFARWFQKKDDFSFGKNRANTASAMPMDSQAPVESEHSVRYD